jgi:hypothetical protein
VWVLSVCAACVCCILLCVCVCVCVCAVIVRCAVSSMCLPMAHPVLLLRERGLTPVPYSDAHIVSCSRLLLVDFEDFEAREHGNQWQFYTVLHVNVVQYSTVRTVILYGDTVQYCAQYGYLDT